MGNGTQTERIVAMERILDASVDCVQALQAALDEYESLLPEFELLDSYYTSKTWLADHDDDAAGLIPQDTSRGVLTEDAVYDLLTDIDAVKRRMSRLVASD